MKPLIRLGAAAALAMLAACSPSDEEAEKACYDKLKADFGKFATAVKQAAEGKSLDAQIAAGKQAVTAYESALSISMIWSDDDQNACDYVSAGPYLQRK